MAGDSMIEVVEQSEWEPVVCPFCGFVAYPGAEEKGWEFDPQTCVCRHLLFVATDYGFSYRSSVFNAHMGLTDDKDSEPRLSLEEASNIDAYTSRVCIPGAIKVAAYTPAPSFFGIYYGFVPSGKSDEDASPD